MCEITMYCKSVQSKIDDIVVHVKLCKVYVDLYNAFLRKPSQMRSDMDHTVLPANYTMVTPQLRNITAIRLILILPSHGG